MEKITNHLFISKVIINMTSKIKIITQKLLLMNNWSEIIKELVNDEVFDLNDIVIHIYDNIDYIKDNEKRDVLAKLIARILVNKNSLSCVEQQINMFKNDGVTVQKKFTRILINEIGEKFISDYHYQTIVIYLGCLIQEATPGDITYPIIVQYSKLCERMLDLHFEHQSIN
jgi:hypothetical protein